MMGDAAEDSLVARLAKQLASLEEKYTALEARFSKAEAPTSPTLAMTIEPITAAQPINQPKEDQSPSSRVKIIVSKWDSDGEPVESTRELPSPKTQDNSGYAFILKKITSDSESGKESSSEIDIISLDLWNLLKVHLRWYPYHIFNEAPVTLFSPYEHIVFAWDHLVKAASDAGSETDKQAKEDLRLLLDIISGNASGDARLDKFFKMRETYKNQEEETVQFEDLWTVFPPGALIYGKPFQNEDQIFLVKDNITTWPQWNTDGREFFPWKLEAWSYDWNDGSFGKTSYILKFEPFDGHRPLTALTYYPFEMHKDYDMVRFKLIERGKLFQRYCTTRDESRMFEYSGNVISEKKGFSGLKIDETDNHHDYRSSFEFDLFRRFLSRNSSKEAPPTSHSSHAVGRVMVDYASFYQYGSTNGRNGSLSRSIAGPECACSSCHENEALAERYRTRFDRLPRNNDWEDEQYLLCPPRVLGYILAEKEWAQLQLTNLKEIPHVDQQNAWNSRLRLADEDSKTLLFDLIKCHVSSETQESDDGEKQLMVNDIVPGKGQGLVILLYGPPGVGKSSTAETIAVAARKPLFSISVADVGTKARHVESNLSKIFSLATSWKAILLIDEADVFLESRGRGGIVQSMDKNALVSVFLRVLEYYKGIMFLTTNQIAEFDIAIPSRIHIAIKYESLSTDQMQGIFRGFLDELNRGGRVDQYDDIMSWLKEDVFPEGLDGRQIRNIITTALDLANADEKNRKGNNKLGKSHIKRAFNNTKKFKRDFDLQMQRYKDSQNKMIQ
ncbi:hypothetical protein F4802DRAFT_590377 [Xylaria palmicola]|nr:hypothetical protein F4802DRAFT_590377 [Xylaria palmicola]